MKRCWWAPVGALLLVAPPGAAQIVGPSTGGAQALAQAERMLGHTKRVLFVAAHPDDEDTELLTYLARGEGAVAAYLSLSRGEGGQNLIGRELGEALGLIRSEELLAARGLDGARQYFTRAFDFGFSKTLAETLTLWPRDTVLKDVVRIVRRFRPQIMVTIFTGTPRDGHGQHQTAGWAVQEAFRVAGDPAVFPELAREEGLQPFTPSKLYRSIRFDTTVTPQVVLPGGALDREIGQSYRQIAMRSRSMHRSQDMGVLQEIGPSAIPLALLGNHTSSTEPRLFAGIDTAAPAAGTREAADLEPYRALVVATKAGVVVDAIADESRLVAGGAVGLRLSVWNTGPRTASARVQLESPDGWVAESACLDRTVVVAAGTVNHCKVVLRVAADAPVTVPYFLRSPRVGALYRWSGPPSVWGEPFDPALVTAHFAITPESGSTVTLDREVMHRFRDQAIGEIRRPLGVVPRVDVTVSPKIKLWPTTWRSAQEVTVTLHHAGRDTTTGTVQLDLPPGWPAVQPQPFRLVRSDERRSFSFAVTPPASLSAGDYAIRANARDAQGHAYDVGLVVVSYPHIRQRGYAIPSTVAVRATPMTLPVAKRIAYVRGASDEVPEALAGVGIPVELLDQTALERGDLSRFDVIVIGSRAYETDQALVENNGRLLDYVRQGGHVLVQYQQSVYFTGNFAPYPMTLAQPHDRVTDEHAPVRILRPEDPIFKAPNRIEARDWDGWVQERGLYFAHTWDKAYSALLESHDPEGPPLEGGLLLTSYGKGTYLYTGLAFFRELTAGVPGAFRLFVNLLDVQSRGALP